MIEVVESSEYKVKEFLRNAELLTGDAYALNQLRITENGKADGTEILGYYTINSDEIEVGGALTYRVINLSKDKMNVLFLNSGEYAKATLELQENKSIEENLAENLPPFLEMYNEATMGF